MPVLRAIEEPHHRLHQSAVDIDKNFAQADTRLSTELQQKKVDHLLWTHRVKDVFVNPSLDQAQVETDGHKCGFGRWFYSDHVHQLRQGDSTLDRICADIEQPHQALHESAIRVNELLAANRRAEALDHYVTRIKPLTKTVLEHIDNIIAWNDKQVVGLQRAKEIYAQESLPSLQQMQALVGKARNLVGDNIMTQDAMLSTARATKRVVAIVSALGIVAGIVLASVIACRIVRTLKNIMGELAQGAEQVASASVQVSGAAQSLAQGATEQASGLEETSSSLEEMSSMTRQNADGAQRASTLAVETHRSAAEGTASMERMSHAIGEIQKGSDETAKIIKVIDEIAFQTNLLALNAAVEAARAGEAGKGFAVVAEEVRNLALRSATAAKNTSQMIGESVKNAENGVELSSEVRKTLAEIVNNASASTEFVREIAAASREQAQGIDQINTTVTRMDKVTQQTAANAEESAGASEELSAQAEQMNQMVAGLVVMVGGTKGQTVGTRAKTTGGTRTHALKVSDTAYYDIKGHSGQDCWDAMECGRIPGGNRVTEFGVCPAYPASGKHCWNVAGTFCGGKVKGDAAQKHGGCVNCIFFKTHQRRAYRVSAAAPTIPQDAVWDGV